jgi:hypothetical protein
LSKKDNKKKVEWKPDEKLTMAITKGKDWKPDKKLTMTLYEGFKEKKEKKDNSDKK